MFASFNLVLSLLIILLYPTTTINLDVEDDESSLSEEFEPITF